jgi:hypothetical protein
MLTIIEQLSIPKARCVVVLDNLGHHLDFHHPYKPPSGRLRTAQVQADIGKIKGAEVRSRLNGA